MIDIHEEPASLATFEVRLLAHLAGVHASVLPVQRQNLPKSYPPPFRWFERSRSARAAAVHTCNDEAGELLRARGFMLSAAAGRTCRNLDFNLLERPEIAAYFERYATGADLALIEGNKGLYDGVDS